MVHRVLMVFMRLLFKGCFLDQSVVVHDVQFIIALFQILDVEIDLCGREPFQFARISVLPFVRHGITTSFWF